MKNNSQSMNKYHCTSTTFLHQNPLIFMHKWSINFHINGENCQQYLMENIWDLHR